MPKATKPSLSKLHKKLWPLFSEFIRKRDCLKTTGTTDRGRCITCGREYEFKQLQAGHFISRVYKSILYDERNCHAQCYGCNVGKRGSVDEYWVAMELKYGRKVIDELMSLKRTARRFKTYELEEMIEVYKSKVREL
jgi:hypothetical protein